MSSMDREVLLIAIATLAESFLLWVLWNFIKASGKRKSSRTWSFGRQSSVVSIRGRSFQNSASRQDTTSAAPRLAEQRRA